MKDNLSGPLKTASKTTELVGKNLEKAKEQVKKYESTINNAQKGINNAKATVSLLSKEYANNSKQIEKTKELVEKYSNTTGLTEKQIQTYSKRLAEAKNKLHALEKAQETNISSTKTAQNVISNYEKTISKNSEKLVQAKTKVREFAKSISEINKKVDENQKKLNSWGKSLLSTTDNIVKRTLQGVTAIGSITGTFALKTGFSEAMDMEGYKMQLETATKSTEKASKLMVNAVKYANATPFETGEVIGSVAKMEAMGASSERWLKDVADMAGATNKSIDQATEAMIDARKGEYERLKEFGLDKEMVMAKAVEKYGKRAIMSKKNETQKRAMLENALQELMQEKFKGGAEKQSKTISGLLSTITGMTKISLAKIVGMTESGTIKQGSLYDKLKIQLEKVVAILTKWQESGAIEKIGDKVVEVVGKMINFFSELFEFIKKHRVLIETILIFVSSMYLAIKVITLCKTVLLGLSIVWGVLNGTLALSPITLIALVIAGVVTACYLLWQHLDTLVNMFKNFFGWIKNIMDNLGEFAFLLGGPIAPILGLIQHFDKLKEIGEKALGIIKKIFGIKGNDLDTTITEKEDLKKTITNKNILENPKTQTMALNNIKTSTSQKEMKVQNKPYFGEDKRFSDNEQAKKQDIKIEVNLSGDFYGFEDFQDKVCEAVVKAVQPILINMVRKI